MPEARAAREAKVPIPSRPIESVALGAFARYALFERRPTPARGD
jgi:hypothetical protein